MFCHVRVQGTGCARPSDVMNCTAAIREGAGPDKSAAASSVRYTLSNYTSRQVRRSEATERKESLSRDSLAAVMTSFILKGSAKLKEEKHPGGGWLLHHIAFWLQKVKVTSQRSCLLT